MLRQNLKFVEFRANGSEAAEISADNRTTDEPRTPMAVAVQSLNEFPELLVSRDAGGAAPPATSCQRKRVLHGWSNTMTEQPQRSPRVHRWYTRPVFFVADVDRALRFYIDMLGFELSWHAGDGTGKVCQVAHG